jgi:hypothetical protein
MSMAGEASLQGLVEAAGPCEHGREKSLTQGCGGSGLRSTGRS